MVLAHRTRVAAHDHCRSYRRTTLPHEAARDLPKHGQARLHPSEVMSLALLIVFEASIALTTAGWSAITAPCS